MLNKSNDDNSTTITLHLNIIYEVYSDTPGFAQKKDTKY